MQRIKLADVARAAGVHPGTASRALNPQTREQVSPATVRRVTRAAQRLGYVPNPVARGLRTARSFLIGMVVYFFYARSHAKKSPYAIQQNAAE